MSAVEAPPPQVEVCKTLYNPIAEPLIFPIKEGKQLDIPSDALESIISATCGHDDEVNVMGLLQALQTELEQARTRAAAAEASAAESQQSQQALLAELEAARVRAEVAEASAAQSQQALAMKQAESGASDSQDGSTTASEGEGDKKATAARDDAIVGEAPRWSLLEAAEWNDETACLDALRTAGEAAAGEASGSRTARPVEVELEDGDAPLVVHVGATVLHLAAARGWVEVCHSLLRLPGFAARDAEAMTSAQLGPLTAEGLASWRWGGAWSKVLFSEGPLGFVDAAVIGDEARCLELLRSGRLSNEEAEAGTDGEAIIIVEGFGALRLYRGATALHFAAARGWVEVCRRLLELPDGEAREARAGAGRRPWGSPSSAEPLGALSPEALARAVRGAEWSQRAFVEEPLSFLDAAVLGVEARCLELLDSGSLSGEDTGAATDGAVELNVEGFGWLRLLPGATALHFAAARGWGEVCHRLLELPDFTTRGALALAYCCKRNEWKYLGNLPAEALANQVPGAILAQEAFEEA